MSPPPTRDDMVRDVKVEVDWSMKRPWEEVRTLPLGRVQVMVGTGRPSKEQFSCTLRSWGMKTEGWGDVMLRSVGTRGA